MGALISSVLTNKSTLTDLPSYNANDLYEKSYFNELVSFLAHYNVLGQNGSTLLSFINDGNAITKENYLSGYIGYLATYTGSRTFGKNGFDTSVADIPLENVTLKPANISLSGEHDISSILTPATLTNNNVEMTTLRYSLQVLLKTSPSLATLQSIMTTK